MTPRGFNPLRWNCQERGCFNIKKRPKIELFADCFPGAIGMGDVDGIVELNSHFLLLEWKEALPVRAGQRIMYQNMTRDRNFHVFVVIGNPESMQVSQYAIFNRGKMSPFVASDLEALKARVRDWVKFAQAQRMRAA